MCLMDRHVLRVSDGRTDRFLEFDSRKAVDRHCRERVCDLLVREIGLPEDRIPEDWRDPAAYGLYLRAGGPPMEVQSFEVSHYPDPPPDPARMADGSLLGLLEEALSEVVRRPGLPRRLSGRLDVEVLAALLSDMAADLRGRRS